MENNKKYTGLAVASLTLGIISIVTTLFWYISIPTGILAIIFGVKAIKNYGSKLGKSGLITGIIGISLCLLIYLFILGVALIEIL